MSQKINSDAWIKLLAGPLPGEEAQVMMSTSFRGEFHHERDPVPAAVLILLYPLGAKTGLAMMKRKAYDGPHSAQVSLPGGAWEEDDKSLAGTALRETREELGINEEIEILGALSHLHIPVSNFLVSPFVAHCRVRPSFLPDPSEVEYIIETTLEHLLDPANLESRILHHHGQDIRAPYYRVGNETVWGATAMILAEFLQLASRLPALPN